MGSNIKETLLIHFAESASMIMSTSTNLHDILLLLWYDYCQIAFYSVFDAIPFVDWLVELLLVETLCVIWEYLFEGGFIFLFSS